MTRTSERARHPHLPAGRSPGPQSQRTLLTRRQDAPISLFVAALVGLGGLAVLILELLIGGDAAARPVGAMSHTRVIVIGSVLVAAGIGYLLFAWYQRRGTYERTAGDLRLELDREEVRRGAPLRATLANDRPGRGRVEVGLECFEHYDIPRGSQTTGEGQTRRAVAWSVWLPVDQSARRLTVDLLLPQDAPYSWEGRVLSYAWRVSARRPSRWRPDPRRNLPIWVLP